jgi:ATP/maltotriose-dependent transcriptional regulator MalT
MNAPGGGALGGDDRELLGLLADGWSQSAIAGALEMSADDLRSMIRGVFDRLGIAGPSPASAARLVLVQDAMRRAPAGD